MLHSSGENANICSCGAKSCLIFKELQSTQATQSEMERLKIENQWLRKRVDAAENYIAKSPCDPDIYPDQWKAYCKWREILLGERK